MTNDGICTERGAAAPAETLLALVEALALAIDAKDQRSHTHVRRMQEFAVSVGEAMDMPPDDLEALRTAALLHDIGKLAVPEHILSKPGPLTGGEVTKIHLHPVVGAEIIASVPFPHPVAPLILSHHERWDGRGYPSQLKGRDIPLGARILAVIDFYDALTTDRPYHPAMSHQAAVRLVLQEAGRAFDPHVVARFVERLPELRARFDGAAPPPLVNPVVLEAIRQGNREMYQLYELSQAIGRSLGVAETMRLMSSRLAALVPYSCCALYLYDATNDSLRCAFATGTDADVLRRAVVRGGRGNAGWVARNRQSLVNASPAADLEASGLAVASTGLQSALVCPLVSNEEVIGAVGLYHTTPGYYGDDHCRLLERVGEHAAAAIANSIAFEKTQRELLTDALTGLPNTRFLAVHLARELARAERLKSEVALLVVGLDGLRPIEDTCGRPARDDALRAVATALRTLVRAYDICVRDDDDKFILVLPGCGATEAGHKLDAIRSTIAGIRVEAPSGEALPIAASAGVAVFPAHGATGDTLLTIADARMCAERRTREGTA